MLSLKKNNQTLLLSITLFLVFLVTLTVSLFYKDQRLWMDEILSYLLISDPSIAHLNEATVSNMDANPPLFANLYWLLGHFVSLDPLFLKAVSIALFAATIALTYTYATRLLGSPLTSFVLFSLILSLTYLNYTLATQIRTYCLFLLVSALFFGLNHQLIHQPTKPRLLLAQVLVGLTLTLTHNFGLFYAAATGAFFGLLWISTRQKAYLWVLGAHLLILVLWLLIWYPNFAIQSQAGQPHSWIPLPTFLTFFQITAEAIPTFSAKIERLPALQWLPILRVALVVGLWGFIITRQLQKGIQRLPEDKAFSLFVLSGFIFLMVTMITLVVSLVHTSVFLSRYLWPNHLLVVYILMYSYYYLADWRLSPKLVWALPLYVLLLIPFMFYQNKKVPTFSGEIADYLPKVNKAYPIFFESGYYFLPIWYYNHDYKIRYLLDPACAFKPGNQLSSTTDFKIIQSVKDKYNVKSVIDKENFNRLNFPHFYVVDEASRYQIEDYIKNKRVRIVSVIPVNIEGHRILECTL